LKLSIIVFLNIIKMGVSADFLRFWGNFFNNPKIRKGQLPLYSPTRPRRQWLPWPHGFGDYDHWPVVTLMYFGPHNWWMAILTGGRYTLQKS